jgi:HEAT repeat protein
LPVLINMLESAERDATGEPAWAAKAVSLLGPHGREATPALAEAVLDDQRGFAVRQLSLEALARIGGAHPEAVPAIISVVQLSPSDEVQGEQQAELRLLAVEALGVVGADAAVAVPLLARIVRSPRESEALRRRSAESLAAIGPAARFALDALAESLIGDPSEAVRDAATKALGALGEPACPVLQRMLKHEDVGVRWRAAQALGIMGEPARPSARALKFALANKDEAEVVRLHAATSLWKLEADAAHVWPTAVELLASDDRNVRMQSLDLLVSLWPPAKAAAPQLHRLTHHPRREVRQIAEQALRKLATSPP